MSEVVRFEVTTRVADNTDLQKLRQRFADTIRAISNHVREDEGITVVTNVKIIRDEPMVKDGRNGTSDKREKSLRLALQKLKRLQGDHHNVEKDNPA